MRHRVLVLVFFSVFTLSVSVGHAQFRRDLGRVIGNVAGIDSKKGTMTVIQDDIKFILKIDSSQASRVTVGTRVFVSFKLETNDVLFLKVLPSQ